ncbi:MAG: CinA family nicotinamide mononucleotide deamidase-related protein [Deltaproteobacteria bacterium]|nr:CinA family nicotinamide mononucleotide deamidase-related protein [Deltaproteobacteria bacterium]
MNPHAHQIPTPVAHILTVGDELLAGDIVDGNKAKMASCARAQGLEVRRAVTVRDRLEEIAEALRQAAEHADVCLVSGGLGPTTDDLTSASVAEAAGVSMVRDAEAEARLEEKFRRYGRPMADANRKQADFPEGADILANPIGSAEGLRSTLPGGRQCQVFVMPGVPRELEKMLAEQVVPRLHERFGLITIPRRVYRVLGHGESSVAAKVEPLVAEARLRSPGLAAVYVHYRASMPEVSVIVEATQGDDGPRATVEELASFDAPFIEVLSPGIYGIGAATLPPRVVAAMVEARLRLAVAESCTGGGLGAQITAVPGSSACFRGGIISYDNEIKQSLLGVAEALLVEHGAVSEPVSRAMAVGARDRFGSDLGVGITGIAGPGGGSPEKPVGTVHVAVADGSETFHKALRLRGNRGTVQRAAALWATKLVWDRLVARGVAAIDHRHD